MDTGLAVISIILISQHYVICNFIESWIFIFNYFHFLSIIIIRIITFIVIRDKYHSNNNKVFSTVVPIGDTVNK